MAGRRARLLAAALLSLVAAVAAAAAADSVAQHEQRQPEVPFGNWPPLPPWAIHESALLHPELHGLTLPSADAVAMSGIHPELSYE